MNAERAFFWVRILFLDRNSEISPTRALWSSKLVIDSLHFTRAYKIFWRSSRHVWVIKLALHDQRNQTHVESWSHNVYIKKDAMISEKLKFWLRLLFSDPNPEILAILTFLMIMACDRLPWLQPLVKPFWWLIWTCLRYQTCSSWSGVSNARWIMVVRCVNQK